MAFAAGKNAKFTIATVDYKMNQWSINLSISEIDVTNFESANDWREYLNGFKGGQLSASGPYDLATALPDQGASVAFTCQADTGKSFTGNAVVTSIGISTSVDNALQLNLGLRITGAVTFPATS